MSNIHYNTVRTPAALASRHQVAFSGLFVQMARGVFDRLYTWQERAQERAQLATLESRLLSDVGLSRSQAEAETAKPFWRP